MSDLLTTPARSERQRARRRTRRARRIIGWIALAAVAAGVTYVVTREPGSVDPSRDPDLAPLATTLVAMRLADDPSGAADSLTLIATAADGTEALRVFIPSGTLAPIPGHGFEPLANALGKGDARLLELSIENLLGLRIDATVVVDDVSLGRLVDAVGGITVTVPDTLTEIEEGISEQVATEGAQRMDGAQALTYMTYRGGDETELTRFVRAQAVLDAISMVDRAQLTKAARSVTPEGATLADDLRVAAGLFARRVERANLVLPVESAGGAGAGELYRVNTGRMQSLLRTEVGGAMFTLERRPRVDVRNGSGVPAIGERAAALLVPAGFAIELSGNAQDFSEPKTRIVIYRDSPETRALADRARATLGVGTIELTTRGQSVVDLTIVIGDDFQGRTP